MRREEGRGVEVSYRPSDAILENLTDGVYLVDRERRITYWNRGAESLTGFDEERVVGRLCYEDILRHVDGNGRYLCRDHCPLAEAMELGHARRVDVLLHHQDGHRVSVSVRAVPPRNGSGEVVGAVEVFSDDSAHHQLRGRVEELERTALINSLTGVPNHRYLRSQLDARCAELDRYGWGFGILFMDVDHFKSANDTHGHLVGDRVLRMVALTPTGSARASDTTGRWGGEEFLALVTNIDSTGLIEIGNRFRSLVGASELPGPEKLRVTLSFSAAVARRHESAERLLQRADASLYRTKASGRNRVCFEEEP